MEKKSYRECSDTEFQETIESIFGSNIATSFVFWLIIGAVIFVCLSIRINPVVEFGMMIVNAVLCSFGVYSIKKAHYVSFTNVFVIFIGLTYMLLFYLCCMDEIKMSQAVIPFLALFGVIQIIVPRINSFIKKKHCTLKMEIETIDMKYKIANNSSVDAFTGEKNDISFIIPYEVTKKISVEDNTYIIKDSKKLPPGLHYLNPENIYEIYSPAEEKSFCRTMTFLGCFYIFLEAIFFLMMKYA